jgi:chromosomal replication initiator protein
MLSIWKGELPNPKPTMREMAMEVAEKHGVTLEDLQGPSRTQKLATARQEAMARIYATGRYSTTQVGRFFGGRDHTTVMHGCRAHARRLRA